VKHTLVALVENEPGVLNRVVSLFRRRNFNIDSLTVGRTESPDVSRMTIVVDSSLQDISAVEKNLYKLVNVITVHDVSQTPLISRDLALIKVRSAEGVSDVCLEYGARIIDVSGDVGYRRTSRSVDRAPAPVRDCRVGTHRRGVDGARSACSTSARSKFAGIISRLI